jgi:hypothetical protein
MLGPEQWLVVDTMEIYDNTLDYIEISALDIVLLSSDLKEGIIQETKLDDEYVQVWEAVTKGETVDTNYTVQDNSLTSKRRKCMLKAIRRQVMRSENDPNIAGHIDTARTMELISRN